MVSESSNPLVEQKYFMKDTPSADGLTGWHG